MWKNIYSVMSRIIKSYSQFFDSLQITISGSMGISESLGVMYDAIMSSIGAEEVDLMDTLKLPGDYQDRLSLDFLSDDIVFVNSLASLGLKKSGLQNSEDFETYLSRPCRFMMVYNVESNELENPVFILIQSWNESLSDWETLRLFRLNGDVKKFYDKLSSKVIQIEKDGKKYIYNSTNRNEWVLQNPDRADKRFKKYLRTPELEEILKEEGIKLHII
jgi:hypothetical protein